MSLSYVEKLFAGEIRFAVTFWFFCILIGFIAFTELTMVIKENEYSIYFMEYGNIYLQIIYGLVLVYGALIAIAVWRSAKQSKIHVAFFATSTLVASLIAFIDFGYYTVGTNVESKFETVINRHLPDYSQYGIKVNQVSIKNRLITYNITYTDKVLMQAIEQKGTQSASDLFKKLMKPSVCRNSLLLKSKGFLYKIKDEQGNRLFNTLITRQDCS